MPRSPLSPPWGSRLEATPPREAPLRLSSPSPSSPGGETPVDTRPKLNVKRYGSEPEPRTFSPLPPSPSTSSSLPGAPSRSPRPCFPLTGAFPCCPPALRLALPARRLLPAGPGAECRRRCLRAAQPLQLPGPADRGAAPSRRSTGEARWLQLLHLLGGQADLHRPALPSAWRLVPMVGEDCVLPALPGPDEDPLQGLHLPGSSAWRGPMPQGGGGGRGPASEGDLRQPP
eukprot:bmy_21013T0